MADDEITYAGKAVRIANAAIGKLARQRERGNGALSLVGGILAAVISITVLGLVVLIDLVKVEIEAIVWMSEYVIFLSLPLFLVALVFAIVALKFSTGKAQRVIGWIGGSFPFLMIWVISLAIGFAFGFMISLPGGLIEGAANPTDHGGRPASTKVVAEYNNGKLNAETEYTRREDGSIRDKDDNVVGRVGADGKIRDDNNKTVGKEDVWTGDIELDKKNFKK